jgi:hypothetical protein
MGSLHDLMARNNIHGRRIIIVYSTRGMYIATTHMDGISM